MADAGQRLILPSGLSEGIRSLLLILQTLQNLFYVNKLLYLAGNIASNEHTVILYATLIHKKIFIGINTIKTS